MPHEEIDVPVLWEEILHLLKQDPNITPQTHGFIDLIEPKGIISDTLYLEVPNDFTRGMIEQRCRLPLLQALSHSSVSNKIVSFAIFINPDIHVQTIQQTVSETDTSAIHELPSITEYAELKQQKLQNQAMTQLNPKYTFDNFVIGHSNRFAHAAAVAVAEAPAKAYNPLFIYGDSGLGKTHLLHAIGHYAMNLYPDLRVRYVSSEEFTNDFINSIAHNKGASFQARYRNIDILLIDDIQFLQRAVETQEAFFHTFNNLHDHNKQVVITSDVSPKHLTGFENRMRSRFEWGLITDVQMPDLETRIAILRKKSESENFIVSDEVLEFVASKISNNIRELEGTLIRITAFASLNQASIDIDLVQTVLKDIITLDEDSIISPTDIISQTAKYFKISVEDIYGPNRSQSIALARQIAMYLCRELTNLSLPKIGQIFGNRDHTTIMYANKKIIELMKEKRSIYNQVTELTSIVKQHKS